MRKNLHKPKNKIVKFLEVMIYSGESCGGTCSNGTCSGNSGSNCTNSTCS